MGARGDRIATLQASLLGPKAAGPLQKAAGPHQEKRRIREHPVREQSPTKLLLHSPAPFAAAAPQGCSGAQEQLENLRRIRGSGRCPGNNSQKRELLRSQDSPRLSIWTSGCSLGSQTLPLARHRFPRGCAQRGGRGAPWRL